MIKQQVRSLDVLLDRALQLSVLEESLPRALVVV